MATPIRWTVITNGVLGLWLFAAPFALGAPAVDRLNDVLIGSVVMTVAGYNYYREQAGDQISRRADGICTLLGCWMLFAPFAFGISGTLLWNDVIAGVGVISFSLYNIYAAPRIRRSRPEASS